jgi:hypothetical protein
VKRCEQELPPNRRRHLRPNPYQRIHGPELIGRTIHNARLIKRSARRWRPQLKDRIMVTFFKRYIAEHMNNTESLSDGAYRVHDVTEELIMLNEGPITDNERGIAGRCNMRPDRYRAYRDELVQAGKIRIADGKISIDRCIVALAKIEDNRRNAGDGGKQSGKTRRKLSNETQNDEVSMTSRSGLDEVSMTSRSGLDEVSMTSRSGLDEVSMTSRSGLDEVSNDNPLKTNDTGEAPLQQDRSLKDSLRLTKTKDSRRVSGETPTNDSFDRFKAAYPRRRGGDAWKVASKIFLRKLRDGANAETIIASAKRFAEQMATENRTGTEFVPMAKTWLGQDRWNDGELEKASSAAPPRPVPKFFFEIDSREWKVWDKHMVATTGRRPFIVEREKDRKRGSWFHTDSPPVQEAA